VCAKAFQQIYQAPDMQTFKTLLQKWYHWVSKCTLAPMVKTAKMIKRHWSGIFLNFSLNALYLKTVNLSFLLNHGMTSVS
jgi:transposase